MVLNYILMMTMSYSPVITVSLELPFVPNQQALSLSLRLGLDPLSEEQGSSLPGRAGMRDLSLTYETLKWC